MIKKTNKNYDLFKVKMFMRKWQDMLVVGKEIYLGKEKYLRLRFIKAHHTPFSVSIIGYKK